MMKHLHAVILLAALPLLAQPAPDLRTLVERFDTAQARAETIQATFTLSIRRAMLRTPTITRGTLYIQGSSFVHFAFDPPEDLILHLTPKALISYSPRTKEGEVLKIGIIRHADRKVLGLGQKLAYLSDYFQIQQEDDRELPETYALRLNPRSLSIKRRLQLLRIWMDRSSSLPRRMVWVERNGDTWQLDLSSVQTNRPIPGSIQTFSVPAGTQLRNGFSFFANGRK
nr:outer membrane lipoprotein carrier protein LolA [uncultured Holophaga sp.]